MYTKLVAKFMDGKVMKGFSDDFLLMRETFHIRAEQGTEPHEEVRLSDLKAIFFVGNHFGNKEYDENKSAIRPTYHHRVSMRFHDGEEIVGYTDDDIEKTDVIRVVPTDPMSNNTLIFVVKKNTKEIKTVTG